MEKKSEILQERNYHVNFTDKTDRLVNPTALPTTKRLDDNVPDYRPVELLEFCCSKCSKMIVPHDHWRFVTRKNEREDGMNVWCEDIDKFVKLGDIKPDKFKGIYKEVFCSGDCGQYLGRKYPFCVRSKEYHHKDEKTGKPFYFDTDFSKLTIKNGSGEQLMNVYAFEGRDSMSVLKELDEKWRYRDEADLAKLKTDHEESVKEWPKLKDDDISAVDKAAKAFETGYRDKKIEGLEVLHDLIQGCPWFQSKYLSLLGVLVFHLSNLKRRKEEKAKQLARKWYDEWSQLEREPENEEEHKCLSKLLDLAGISNKNPKPSHRNDLTTKILNTDFQTKEQVQGILKEVRKVNPNATLFICLYIELHKSQFYDAEILAQCSSLREKFLTDSKLGIVTCQAWEAALRKRRGDFPKVEDIPDPEEYRDCSFIADILHARGVLGPEEGDEGFYCELALKTVGTTKFCRPIPEKDPDKAEPDYTKYKVDLHTGFTKAKWHFILTPFVYHLLKKAVKKQAMSKGKEEECDTRWKLHPTWSKLTIVTGKSEHSKGDEPTLKNSIRKILSDKQERLLRGVSEEAWSKAEFIIDRTAFEKVAEKMNLLDVMRSISSTDPSKKSSGKMAADEGHGSRSFESEDEWQIVKGKNKRRGKR